MLPAPTFHFLDGNMTFYSNKRIVRDSRALISLASGGVFTYTQTHTDMHIHVYTYN